MRCALTATMFYGNGGVTWDKMGLLGGNCDIIPVTKVSKSGNRLLQELNCYANSISFTNERVR
jgi:hypothetical protein